MHVAEDPSLALRMTKKKDFPDFPDFSDFRTPFPIFAPMKRTVLIAVIAFSLSACHKTSYKLNAIEYLKKNVPYPASVDTIRFLKPDSIYTSFIDTRAYANLKNMRDSLIDEKNMAEAAKMDAVIKNRTQTYHNILVGWDVSLIYKAKNKKGILKTDTCRFTFNDKLYDVKDLNGVDL